MSTSFNSRGNPVKTGSQQQIQSSQAQDILPKELQSIHKQYAKEQQAQQKLELARQKNIAKKQQKYALQQQAAAQEKARQAYKTAYYKLQQEYGAAKNDTAKLAELDEQKNNLIQKYKDDMAATTDLEQYKKTFNLDEYDKAQNTSTKENITEGSNNEQENDNNTEQENDNSTEQENDNNTEQENVSSNSSVATNSLVNYLASKTPGGTSQEPNSIHLRRQSEMHDKQAGDEQKNAQQNFQVANRNYRVEAEKNAASQAAAENAQKVSNMGNASAGAAALERTVEKADYNTHMQRQDQQRSEGVKNQREMWGARQTAEEERANADKGDHDYLQAQLYNNAASSLSMGGVADENKNNSKQPKVNKEPSTLASQDEKQEINGGNLHVLMNYIQGSTKDADKYNTPEIQALIKKYGVKPLPKELQTFNHEADKKIAELYPEFMSAYNKATGRNVSYDNQEDATSDEDIKRYQNDAEIQQSGTGSDSRIKNIISAISSIRF